MKLLFFGNESRMLDFSYACRLTRIAGYDTIAVKRAEGSERWYGPTTLQDEQQTAHTYGLEYLPWQFAYGAYISPTQHVDEAKIMAEMFAAVGVGMLDIEEQWRGHADVAEALSDILEPIPGYLYVTCYGDPMTVGLADVYTNLAPCVNRWVPQLYTPWLVSEYPHEKLACFTHVLPTYTKATISNHRYGDYAYWEAENL